MRRVRDGYGAWPEEERRAPAIEQRDVARERYRCTLEAGQRRKMLRGNVRREFQLGSAQAPALENVAHVLRVAHETHHELRYRFVGDDVRLASGVQRADVYRGAPEHGIRGKLELLECGE